jgi:prepilin-type N-terminal cleavage/methylation domain-containing protein
MKRLRKSAYTLIELVFVIVVIGILSAVALPKFFGVQKSATEANIKKEIQAIRASIQSEHAQRIAEDVNITQGSGGGQLWLYYNFQPWLGETYMDGNKTLLMQNVATFRYIALGSLIKVQLCISDANLSGIGGYAVCKEKTIF